MKKLILVLFISFNCFASELPQACAAKPVKAFQPSSKKQLESKFKKDPKFKLYCQAHFAVNCCFWAAEDVQCVNKKCWMTIPPGDRNASIATEGCTCSIYSECTQRGLVFTFCIENQYVPTALLTPWGYLKFVYGGETSNRFSSNGEEVLEVFFNLMKEDYGIHCKKLERKSFRDPLAYAITHIAGRDLPEIEWSCNWSFVNKKEAESLKQKYDNLIEEDQYETMCECFLPKRDNDNAIEEFF